MTGLRVICLDPEKRKRGLWVFPKNKGGYQPLPDPYRPCREQIFSKFLSHLNSFEIYQDGIVLQSELGQLKVAVGKKVVELIMHQIEFEPIQWVGNRFQSDKSDTPEE